MAALNSALERALPDDAAFSSVPSFATFGDVGAVVLRDAFRGR